MMKTTNVLKLKTVLKLSFLAKEIAIYSCAMKSMGMTFTHKKDVYSVAKAIRKNAKAFAYVLSNDCTDSVKQLFGITSQTFRNICKTPLQLNFLASESIRQMKAVERAAASKKKAFSKNGIPVQMEFDFNA